MRKSFTRLFSIFVLLLGLSFQMAYGIVFVPASSVPTDGNSNAKPTDFATKFVVAFDVVPVISDAGGTVVIYKGGGLFKTLPITKTSANVVVVGKTIEITHGITTFTAGEVYNVAITDGAITGLAAGALNSTVYDFTIGDYVAPQLLTAAASFTPAKGAVDVMATLNSNTLSLVIPFNEAVDVPAATNDLAVYIYKEDGTVVDIIKVGKVGSTTVVGGGTATITVPVAATAIFQENTKYYVSVDAGAFVDASPNKNAFGGLSSVTTWTFTTRDNSAPAVSSKSVTAVTQTTATLNVTLPEKGKYYYVVQLASVAAPSAATVAAGTAVTVATANTNVTASLSGLLGGNSYKVYIVTENSVTVGAPVVGTTVESVSFTTVDNTAPLAVSRGSLTDAAKKTNKLYMVFNEQVVGGSGSLDLRKSSDESYVKSVPASAITSTKITLAADATKYGAAINDWVTVIDLGMTLPSQVAYYVVFPDGYIKDVAGNKFNSGGTFIIPINKGDWNVTSSDFELPTVTVAFATPTSLTSDITITFNETVAKALGTTAAWSDVVALEQNNTPVAFTVLPAAAANTTVITLTPGAALTSNTVYTVKLRPNAVKDLNDNTIVPETVYTVTTGDLDGLAVQYGSSEGAVVTTGLAANSTIKIDFNKAVKVNTTGTTWVAADATNLKPLITFSKGATAKAFTVTYDAATFTATVTPTDALVCNASDYSLVFDGTKIKDVVGTTLTSVTTAYTVKDYNAPVATTSHSGDVSTVMPLTVTLADDNLGTLTDLSGTALSALSMAQLATHITFKDGSSSGANLGFAVASYAAGVITITPTAALATDKTYYYGIGASVKDAAGNVTAGKFSTFKMITPAVAPAIVANTYTLNGSAQTPVATKLVNIVPKTGNIVSVTVTFNDNIKETQSVPAYNTVSLTDGVGTWTANVTPTSVSGNTLTVDFSVGGPLASEAVCTLTLPAGIVQGSTAYDATPLFAQFTGKTILFDSKDVVKPVLTANTPAAAAVGVALNTAIKVDFSEKVILGTGNILIKEGTTTVQTIPVTSANVSLNAAGTTATITKTGDLPKYNTVYTLEIPSAAFTDDLSLNTLSALYSGTFTTLPNPAPSIATLIPADNSDMVALNTAIAMTFDEEVEKNYTPGVLTLKGIYLIEKKDGNGQLVAPNYQFNADPASAGTNDDVLVASKYIDDSAVAISGNTVTVNFGVALAANKDYYILVAPDAFRDKSLGSPIPGLSSGIITYGLWNFTTKDENAPTIAYSYTKRADNKVAITSDITITFSKPIEKVSGSAINSSDVATLFTLTKVSGPGTLGVKAFIGDISADKTVVKILNSSLVTLGEMTELSNYTIALNAGAIRGVTNHVVLGGSDAFTTSDYTAPVVTPSIVAAIADVKKDEATVQFVSTDNMNLASVYYTIQPGTSSTAAPSAAVVKSGVMAAIVGASPKTTTHKFTGLTEETSYVVWAVAVDEAGNESAVNKVVFITDDVTKPTLAVKPASFDAAGKLTFTFSEAVSPAAASVRILDKASMKELAVLGLNAVAGKPDQLITDAFAPAISNTLVEYYVEIDKGLVGDVPVVAGDAINTYDGLFRTELMVTSKDVTLPTFVSTVPALPATGVDLNFSIKLNFSEAVQKASTIAPNAFLVEKWNGAAYEAYEVIDPAYVVTNGTSEVTVTLTRALSSTTMYRLTLDLASFKDMSGNAHAAGTVSGTITTKDVVAPAVTFLPAKNATAVASTTTLTMTFAEAIRLLDNSAIDKFDLDSLVWVKKAGVSVAFTAAINPAATVITLTIPATANDQTYSYGFKAKFEDASDNAIPADMASFNTVTTSPAAQYLTWTPVKAVAPATSTWLGSTAAITLNFTSPVFTLSAVAADNNLPVTAAYLASTALKVYEGASLIAPANLIFTVIDNKTFTVAPKTNWTSSALVKVEVVGGTLQVNEGNVVQLTGAPFDASVYKAEDIIAPKVDATMGAPYTAGFYPAKVGLAGVSPVVAKTETLKLYFDEDVKVGTGKVEIYRWDGVLAQPASLVSVAADKRTVSLGDLSVLPTNQEYYIVVNPAIVVDVNDGMAYAGLTDVKVWKFILKDDAVPQVQAYMPVISNTPVTTDLTLNFDRNVALTGAGYVAIYESAAGGDAIQIWRGADNGTTNALSVSGSTATVNISDLAVNTQYFVEVAAGTFKGATSGENQLAISRNDWSFTTEVNANPVIIAGGYVPAQNALQVDVNSNLEITFDMPVQAGTGNIQLHAANGSMVYNFDVKGTDVTFAGDKVTVNLPTMMITSQYYVIIPATAIRNTTYSPEYFGGITVPYFWKFNTTTDVVAPTVVADSYSPMGMVPTPEGINFSIKFSEVVMAGTGAITIKNTDDNTVIAVKDVMFNADSTVTFNAATPLTFAKYQVLVPANAIKDGNNNFYDPTALAWNFEISDLTAPSVAGLSPADGTVGLPGINDLKITFSEPVMLSSATAEIKVYKQGLLGNSLVYHTPITAANLSADMKTVTVTTDSLADRTSYMVLVDANLVKDVAGNQFAGINDPTVWNYETGDYSGPVVASITTASLTNAKNTFAVDIMFDENVTGVADNVTVTNGTVVVTGSGKAYVATVTAEDAAVVVLTVGTGVKDVTAQANPLSAAVSKTITVGDNTAPTLVVTAPATPVATVFTIGLTFSEQVTGGASAVTVTGGTLLDVTGSGTSFEVKVSAAEQTEVTVNITDAIKDMSPNANKFAGKTLTYTTGDFTAPQLLTKTPSADEVIANNHPVLKMSFNENVKVGTGSLKIYKVATTTPALTIPITADMISGKDVTVSYAATQSGLDKNTRYYVLVDGAAINDNAGNAFNGVTDATAWTFKTGADWLTEVKPDVNVSLEFKVYPNPFVDVVNIVSPSSLSKIVVTNIAGQVAKQIVNPSNSIQLNELRSGIYFVSMYDMDNKVVNTAKIVKR